MNVLIISPFFPPNIGGAETHLDSLCKYLEKTGHRVYVVTYQPLTTKARGQRREKGRNVEVYRIQWFAHGLFDKLESYPMLEFLYLSVMLFLCCLIFMLKHGKRIDVIHAHGLNAAFIARFLAKIFNKRIIASIHAIYYLDKRNFMANLIRWTLITFNVIFCLAERSKKDLKAAGLPERKLRIYTQWVDQSKFRPLNRKWCKRKLKLDNRFIVLFVGRLIQKKGIDALLKVASRVDPEMVFVFVGDGPLADKIKEESKIKDNVMFIGKVSEEDLVKYYNAADVLILPSRYEEGFARVVLEALSCGTPLIASKRGCLPEMVDSSVGALIVPTVENITKTLTHFCHSRERLDGLRKNCRRYAEQRFGESNAEHIVKNYY